MVLPVLCYTCSPLLLLLSASIMFIPLASLSSLSSLLLFWDNCRGKLHIQKWNLLCPLSRKLLFFGISYSFMKGCRQLYSEGPYRGLWTLFQYKWTSFGIEPCKSSKTKEWYITCSVAHYRLALGDHSQDKWLSLYFIVYIILLIAQYIFGT